MSPWVRPSLESQWPARLVTLCSAARQCANTECSTERDELWVVLRGCLFAAITSEARRYPCVMREDVEDLASNKALELARRAERGDWDPTGRSAGEVVSYIRSTARRALARLCDQRRGLTSLDEHAEWGPRPSGGGAMTGGTSAAPDRLAEAEEFASALLGCLSMLTERARTVWILRGIHDLTTREIAAHPWVRVSPGNVDVILMRVRETLRHCLGAKGLEPEHLPAGSFTHCWLTMSGLVPGPRRALEE